MTDLIAADTSAVALSFLAGGGEMGERIRAHDWAATPLGPPQDWPQSLKTATRIMLTSRQPIWIGWGQDLIYLYNDPYQSIIGGKHPRALGRPTEEVWREIWPQIGPMLDTAMGGVEGIYVEEELLIMERNGYPEETHYTFSYSPIPDDDGSPGGIICANTDDTDRVISERQLALLRELAARMLNIRSTVEACEQAAAALATDPRDITFALLYLADPGAKAARIVASTGFEQDKAGPAVHALESDAPWPIATTLATHQPVVVEDPERLLSTAPVEGVWGRLSTRAAVLPIQTAGEAGRAGALIVGLNPFRLFDESYADFLKLIVGQIAAAISTGDAYEEERRRAEALAELDRAKTTFFSNISHEFRTPLTLMLAPLEELLEGQVPAKVMREKADVAYRNGARLLRLVNSLLDFSRIEAGRVRASFEQVDLGQFSAEVASSFRSAMEKAGLTLQVEAAALPQPVYVDRDMWEKVLLNLLSNAFKFTFEGGVTVRIEPSADGRAALVKVIDTGAGIPAEEMPRLFERFHRVEGAAGRSFEGSGIGLALVQELVRLHGGAIFADSQLGEGTTFTVSLPLGREHLPEGQVAEAPSRAASPGARSREYVDEALRWLPGEAPGDTAQPMEVGEAVTGKRIVLADDNADMRDYVRRLLLAQGCDVEAVADGQAALEAVRRRIPDLVLSDVMMPRLDGFGLLKAIREDPHTAALPVILLSARAGEEARLEGLDAGADDYLIKPFSARELIARVSSHLELAQVRREATTALFESEARFRNMADHAPVMMWVTTADGQCIYLNRAWYEFTGQREENALGMGWLEAVHPDDAGWSGETFLAANAARQPFSLEYRLRRADGEYRWAIDAAAPRFDDDGKFLGYIGSVIDFTDRKAAQDAMEALNADLEERVALEVAERTKAEEALRQAQKMEAVGQLTGGVAHDFNNLLTVIIGGLDTIKRSGPDDAVRVQRAADMALQGAQRAASLTTRLLAFSRRQPLDPKPLDINVLVRDMTELLHRTLGEQTELEGVLAPRLWTAEVDQNQLESAILNLAVNARDAMPDGGKLTIETANADLDESYAATDAEVVPGQYVMICVSDTGVGMSAQSLARAFEPFFTTKDVGKGTGLGLSMVYGFVKQSGGHVTIYSEQGQGTTVRLYFPRYLGGAEAADVRQAMGSPSASAGETVLLVEDNEEVRAYSAAILSELGYNVLTAGDADAALTVLSSDRAVDLLFTDVVLPGRSGRVLADEARVLRPALKVLFTTGYSRNAIVHHGRLDPGVQLITKPFTFDQLAARVRDLLDRG